MAETQGYSALLADIQMTLSVCTVYDLCGECDLCNTCAKIYDEAVEASGNSQISVTRVTSTIIKWSDFKAQVRNYQKSKGYADAPIRRLPTFSRRHE